MKISINFSRVFAILKKEFIQLKRDVTTLRMIIAIPIIQLLLFGFAINSDPKHLATAIIVQDDSLITRNILSGLKNSDYFFINHRLSSEKEAQTLLQKGEVTFVITIPPDFSQNLIKGSKPYFLIEADATDPTAISGALGSINTIIQSAILRDASGSLAFLSPQSSAYEIRIHKRYNPEGESRYNIVPGLIAIVLTMTCVMMTALSLTRERERGTIENILSMPVKPIEVMIGKITPYVLIGYIQAGIILTASYTIFNVPVIGSLWLLGLGLLIFIICNLALGFTLSAASTNQMQAMQSSTFILLPSILLSGFMFPFHGMPQWAQFMGSILPSTYFIRIVRGVMLKGNNFQEIWPHIWPLLLFMTALTIVTIKVYRKTLD